MESNRPALRYFAALYLILQGIVGLAWWGALFRSEWVRDQFFTSVSGWHAGRLLMPADIILFALLSIATGLLSIGQRRCDPRLLWILVGSVGYATLAAVGWLADPVAKPLGAILMLPTFLLTLASAYLLDAPVEGPAK